MSESKDSSMLANLLFPKIFQTFRVAIQPTKLIIALLAVAIIGLAGGLMDFVTKSVVTTGPGNGQITELQVYLLDASDVEIFVESNLADGGRQGVFTTLADFSVGRLHSAIGALLSLKLEQFWIDIADIFRSIAWAFRYHFVYTLVYSVIKLIVIAIAGGAICRITALQFSRSEKPGLTEAVRYSFKNFSNFFAAPLVPVGIVIFIGLFVFLLGLITNIPWIGELGLAVAMPLCLLAGAAMTLIIVGVVAGFNLMFPAVAYDGSDCFDSVSRSFTYIYARPWRMAWYSGLAAIYGIICYLFVRLFAFLVLATSRGFLGLGVWAKGGEEVNKLDVVWPVPHYLDLMARSGETSGWTQTLSGFVVYLWILLISGLVLAFVISFYFSANTIIYALLRKLVDRTATEEVFTYSGGAFEGVEEEVEEGEEESEAEGEGEPEAREEEKAETERELESEGEEEEGEGVEGAEEDEDSEEKQ